MPEEILKNIYRIRVPLPGNPLRELNSYVIKGRERTMVVDTGFRQEACRQALFAGLRELNVRPEETDVLLTHLHSDHAGLSAEVACEKGSRIFVSEVDKHLMDTYADGVRKTGGHRMDDQRWAQGFPKNELVAEWESNPSISMAPQLGTVYTGLKDGARIECGGYELTCILVPGHTPGQMCFHLEKEGAMLLGDHVLFDITPNITDWENVPDSLGDYLESLKAIRAYDVVLPLPGHRERGDFKSRIDYLLEHHQYRLEEAARVVKENPGSTAYDLAGKMTWKIRANSWAEFPLTQKWFAVGECGAHMDYLKVRHVIREERGADGRICYFPG